MFWFSSSDAAMPAGVEGAELRLSGGGILRADEGRRSGDGVARLICNDRRARSATNSSLFEG